MIDEREIVRRAAETLTPPEPSFDRLVHRRDRVQRSRRIRAGAFGLAVAVAVGWLGVNAIPSGPTPADDRSEELGIFAPVAGRIVYGNLGRGDGGWRGDIWGVDPAAADPRARVQLTQAGIPLAWSSDGTQLLIKRGTPSPKSCCVEPWWNLFVVHADGSETRVTEQPLRGVRGATISPDGSRVVFADYHALNGIDIAGDRPVVFLEAQRRGRDLLREPTFSPDGAQIAYVNSARYESGHSVWVMNADGSDAHQIVANETTLGVGELEGLAWSPAGDRIALGLDPFLRRSNPEGGIYTFATDGSDFERVIRVGDHPYWSPDGSQLAYSLACVSRNLGCGLAIADADGSDIREFGFAASGPWHPGTVGAPDGATKARGWPDTTRNPSGVYSWDGSR